MRKFVKFAVVGAVALGLLVPAVNTGAVSVAGVSVGTEKASASSYLGWNAARLAAVHGLIHYYGNKWRYAYDKKVVPIRRLSGSRIRFGYLFDGTRHGGYITVWNAGGYTYSWMSPIR